MGTTFMSQSCAIEFTWRWRSTRASASFEQHFDSAVSALGSFLAGRDLFPPPDVEILAGAARNFLSYAERCCAQLSSHAERRCASQKTGCATSDVLLCL
mmetsp:Transcript_5784/g.18530  ORF Transcript_5784/g.18530 Transcript_5784/m.18530 type:complete len:99 (+) Transcript_5784:692-988(+)